MKPAKPINKGEKVKIKIKEKVVLSDCDNIYNPKCGANKELLDMEERNRIELGKNPNDDQFLYPNLDDPNFNIKINNKKEFSDTKYDGTIYDVAKHADELSKADYELLPQQAFVKNFMSFQTPYNSLLLFHGLGSGKTCSAIGVCEEMRDYLKQMGISKRIIIVASPNVQDNFKLQLFDERKLKEVDGLWTMKGCLGNKLLKEINPTGMKGLKRDKVVQQVKNIISSSYYFVGYLQFSNDIARHWGKKEEDEEEDDGENEEEKKKRRNKLKELKIRRLQNEYSDSLIVIDEVHNIRISDDSDNKNVAKNLMNLVSVVSNLRLLLLSATPMFNNYKEIIWLLNLMNMNDRRGIIGISDIFDDKTGTMTIAGQELLKQKANGYISYVRGENPYTFPFRIYPNEFAKDKTFNTFLNTPDNIPYPKYQLNGKPIKKTKIEKLSLFLTEIGDVQKMGYEYIINLLRTRGEQVRINKHGQRSKRAAFRNQKAFGYTDLQLPIEALNIIYPHENLQALYDQIEKTPFKKLVDEESEEEDEEENEEEEEEINSDNEDDNEDDISFEEKKELEMEAEALAPIKEEVTDIREEIEDSIENGPELTLPESENVVEEGVGNVEKEEEGLLEIELPPKVKKVVKKSVKSSDKGLHVIEGPTMSNVATLKNVIVEDALSSDASGGAKGKKGKALAKAEIELVIPEEEEEEKEEESQEEPTNLKLNINPKELTGTEGLKRVMNYKDTKTPLIKGEFEYRPGIEPIFNPKNIKKYSAKIANVCNYIYGDTDNSGEKKVSDGIILIYSSYIDAGLIPMALALEEMGFTRFGKNAHTLFKEEPTAVVDVATMEPVSATNKKSFKPARYAMITGDRYLSPNNDADIKVITADNNNDGSEVKVILLSQAGSEGLDFKAIRQIHILDPWYNVSRIEQIIGRGVRNFSHKDLDFVYRNVQIFLYGTLLSDREEEAVDLYVYRLSEIKAVKIGKVTRLLKQVSVDCHINHDQTKLTTEEFKTKLKDKAKVEQILSNHKTIEEFIVGDMDDSATCDYQTCSFECLPPVNEVYIEDNAFNLNTYNETFMLVNSEKIIQRIKKLFADNHDGQFFFKKNVLMRLIKKDRNYPTDQIYAAITQMITDNSEFITDKYGRTGHLINIGEYYFFQPSELNYPNISLFERSRPIDYKHDMIKFQINADIVKPIEGQNANVEKEKGIEKLNGLNIISGMFANYILALLVSKKGRVTKGVNNWYEYCGVIIRKLKMDNEIVKGKDDAERFSILKIFLTQHIIDELMLQERINLMNYLEELEENALKIPEDILTNTLELFNSFQSFTKEKEREENKGNIRKLFEGFIGEIKKYLLNKIIPVKKGKREIKGVVIFDGPSSLFNDGNGNGNLNVYILKNKVWIPAEAEDKRDLEPAIERKYKLTKKDILNKYVGFIGFEINKQYMAFKVKDTTEEKNTAYRCDQSGKNGIIKRINNIEMGTPYEGKRWIPKDPKKTKAENKQKTRDGAFELCIREEFTLRSFQRDETLKEGNKKWFLDTETAIYNEFEKREKKK